MSDLISLPKDRIKVLLLEGISDSAVELLSGAGYQNVTRLTKALDGQALGEALQASTCSATAPAPSSAARPWRWPTG